MRTIFSRPDFLAGVRDMTPPLIGLLPFGLVCGVAAQALGASVWGALGMSAIIFSGAAQIVATQLIAAQAPVAVIVLTCFVVGLRLMMYSAAMAPHLKPLPPRWRNALAFLLTDQAFAAAIRRFRDSGDTRNGASYFLGTGVLLWATWQVSCLAGYWVGNVIPAAWSLEFIVPLCFLALLVPALGDGPTRVAALAAGVAVVALDSLPMRLSLICAGLIGIAAGLSRKAQRRDERARSALWIVIVAVGALNLPVAAVVHRAVRTRPDAAAGGARAALRAGGDADGDRGAGGGPARRGRGRSRALHTPSSSPRSWRRAVAWRTRSAAATIAAGMATLWLTQWAMLRAPRAPDNRMLRRIRLPSAYATLTQRIDHALRRHRHLHRHDDLMLAVNAAITLQRPLLIKGEPGTGKTMLADEVARALARPLLQWHIKSTTKAQQGLYEYDAVSRLRDSQLGDERVADIANYIKRGHAVAGVHRDDAGGAADRRGRQGRHRVPERPAARARPHGVLRLRDARADQGAAPADRLHHHQQREGAAGRVPAPLLLPLHPLPGQGDDGADRRRALSRA